MFRLCFDHMLCVLTVANCSLVGAFYVFYFCPYFLILHCYKRMTFLALLSLYLTLQTFIFPLLKFFVIFIYRIWTL